MTRRKLPALDGFRLVAAILVVAIHTSPLSSVSAGLNFWLTRVVARVAVPFFLMVSGYFLAQHNWTGTSRFLKKTVLLYAAAIVLYLPVNLYAGGFSFPVGWLRAVLWEGTLYHLWYFPALIWGLLLTRLLLRLGAKPALGVAAALYLIGLGGDSYCGLVTRLPLLKSFYALVFSATEYTRNGVFLVPLFLLLGAMGPKLRPAPSAAGFCVALAGMTLEAFWLHGIGAQRHDSMYLFLPLCMVCLFSLLLSCNGGRIRVARDLSLLIYLLHPGCIVMVRAFARLTGTWDILVECSLPFFVSVLALSSFTAWVVYLLHPMPVNPTARAWREIDADALCHNVGVLARAAGPGCELMAVVKADAYGHGAREVARILQKNGIHTFAVACLSEGIKLRRAGIRGDILILGWTAPEQAPLLARWHLTQAVADAGHGRALSDSGCHVHVHLAIDTGMHRLGLSADNLTEIAEMYCLPGIRVDGIFSHLCVSDSLRPKDVVYTSHQANDFDSVLRSLQSQGIVPGKVHLLASYGLLNRSGECYDFVRAGIVLYGVLSEDAPVRLHTNLWPVLSLHARVASVRNLAAGESAGYGRAFVAIRPTTIAVVTIGYADGLPRCLAERGGRVLIHGTSCPMVGRLCMDQLLADITKVENIRPGDPVVLIGCDGYGEIRAETVADQCGTITNELLSRLGHRLPVVVRKSRSLPGFLHVLRQS